MPSQPSSSRSTASLSLGQTPQLVTQDSNYNFSILPPESKGGYGGLDEKEDARLHTRSQATIQGPSDADNYRSRKEQRGQPEGRVSRRPSRRSTDASDTFPTPIDPFPFDHKEQEKGRAHNKVYGHTPEAGRTSNTLLRAHSSRRDRDTGSRKLGICEITVLALRLP